LAARYCHLQGDLQRFVHEYTCVNRIGMDPSIRYLETYARSHLGIEERYMDLFAYPETAAHKVQHQVFREFIEDLKKTERSSTLEGARLCNKLNNWFTEHIRTIDQTLGLFLKAQGQK